MSALRKILSQKTDAQLSYYIDHVDKHTDEAVLLALAELKSRNVELPEGIDELINEKLKTRDGMGNPRQWDHFNKDVEIVELYPQPVIYVFAIFFTVFYASLMLSSNHQKIGKPGYGPLIFGGGSFILLAVVNIYIPIGLVDSFIINAIAGVLMYALFPIKRGEKAIIIRNKPVGTAILWGLLFNFILGLILVVVSAF